MAQLRSSFEDSAENQLFEDLFVRRGFQFRVIERPWILSFKHLGSCPLFRNDLLQNQWHFSKLKAVFLDASYGGHVGMNVDH